MDEILTTDQLYIINIDIHTYTYSYIMGKEPALRANTDMEQ